MLLHIIVLFIMTFFLLHIFTILLRVVSVMLASGQCYLLLRHYYLIIIALLEMAKICNNDLIITYYYGDVFLF